MKNIVVFSLLTAVVGTAHADQISNQLSPQFNTCTDRATSLEAEYNCYSAEDALQKKRLNVAYNRIARHVDPSELAALNKSQKEWIIWRDDTYHYLSDHAGDVADTNFQITEGFMLEAIINQTTLLNEVADSRGL